MRRILITTLALCLFATGATAKDKAAYEAEAMVHLTAARDAARAALTAMKAGDYVTGCPHLKKAGREIDLSVEAIVRYKEFLAIDPSLTQAERDDQVAQMAELEAQSRESSRSTAEQVALRCS